MLNPPNNRATVIRRVFKDITGSKKMARQVIPTAPPMRYIMSYGVIGLVLGDAKGGRYIPYARTYGTNRATVIFLLGLTVADVILADVLRLGFTQDDVS